MVPRACVFPIVLVLATRGCRDDGGARARVDLETYLREVAALEPTAREREVAQWRLERATFARIVIEPFRSHWEEYARQLDAKLGALAAALPAAELTPRRHFADDPRLTRAQTRLRWVVPPLYPSMVAGTFEAVFVRAGDRWYVLDGLDDVMLAHAHQLDPACAAWLAQAGPAGACTDIGWAIAVAAMQDDRERFARACRLAAPRCR